MSSDSALSGIRVLDLTRLLPGGLCTLVLADLGADVLKVEAPPGGDYARGRAPHFPDAEPTTSSASFRGLNRNKRSIVLDLKSAADHGTFLQLVAESDVVVESFRPGVIDRLGIGYTALAEVNPGIVVCSISGWGQHGPLSQAAGHDLNYLAAMGLLSFTGGPGERPDHPPLQVADSASGLFGAVAILAALQERARSGRGQYVDVSIAHSALSFAAMTVAGVLATGTATPRGAGVWSGGAVCYQVYRCRDGWIALGALEEKFWASWCHGVGRPDLLDHRYDGPGSATHSEMLAIVEGRSKAEWADFAAAHDCCLTVVAGLDEALASPLVRERGSVATLAHLPGGPTYDALALPFQLSRTPTDPARLPAPALGADGVVTTDAGERRAQPDPLITTDSGGAG
ncbi:CaiB/BaiF CoA transferase family protein [Pseudofrankia inefficax]|uniref:L-carnitine dehydratase/bile acid-inducible protein F n=1 Tax=Pseudofrankia inefficax (strain DSM 45817 / CECT 9037 / DDB 130130 / EuI1c) TaxID=298654 RepID=E3J7Q9_PSEI1|nr:CoA transferase [Pseudofrankia inefficax]ADP80813.1 L-carnitine dehydratase/bile acid-inducible protein F [Pseudofrankia inefficax]